jgi:TolB-like protein/DNA-binding winged helix-turn-helix (wHTH) protein/Flp pilus assembly protein TadD
VVATVFEFGEFKLDCDRFELYRAGRSLKLERKPMELLILLATRNGHLVSRTEIAERLWARELFVDTEHGTNTAIRKIRQVLRDDPEQPRFLQTVTGKGYRFVIEKNGAAKGLESAEEIPVAASVRSLPDEGAAAESLSAEAVPASSSAAEAKSAQVQPLFESGARRRSWPRLATVIGAICLLAVALFALNVAGLRDRIFSAKPASQIHSIAVIPLVNLSGDASQDYFADGMTDELITMLAKNTALRIVSRTSVMQYKSAQRPVREIARELGVDGILEGSVARSANRVHMNVQLIFAPTDTHVWAESYDRDLGQAFLLPSELSQTVAKEVKTAVSNASPPRYINPEAHDAYLHGRYFWFTFNVRQTLPYFERAIHLQPDYAAAWSGLADTYSLGGMFVFPPKDVMAKAEFAARKALELDDSLPEAHNSMAAWYLFYGWDLPHADAESRRAIELNPNYAEGHYVRHYVLLTMNRPSEALQEEKRAVELEPFARPWGLGAFYISLRQFDTAIAELRMQSQLRPDNSSVPWNLSMAYWFKGMYKESQQEFEKGLQLDGRQEAAAAAHRAFEKDGEKAVEQWGANDIKARARKGYVSPWDVAFIVAFTGDKDETLKYLEAAYREHSPSLTGLQNEPVLDFLHTDPRYRVLVKNMGLPPAY